MNFILLSASLDNKVRAAKDHGKKFRCKLAASLAVSSIHRMNTDVSNFSSHFIRFQVPDKTVTVTFKRSLQKYITV